jgi:hypothetical protein
MCLEHNILYSWISFLEKKKKRDLAPIIKECEGIDAYL